MTVITGRVAWVKMHHTSKNVIVWKNYGLLLSCLKNTGRNGKKESGFNCERYS
jgi:hypothetical protein